MAIGLHARGDENGEEVREVESGRALGTIGEV